MKPLKDVSEDFPVGMVERAALRYLYENGAREAQSPRYEILRVDRFESLSANEGGTVFAIVVKELFLLPHEQKEDLTRLVVLLATFQEDRSLKISTPIMSAHLGNL